MEQLDDERLAHFDTEYMTESRLLTVKERIDRDFPSGRFTFLDVGGGNGAFADRILASYPDASGVVLDSSQFLLDRNRSNERKSLVLESAANLERLTGC